MAATRGKKNTLKRGGFAIGKILSAEIALQARQLDLALLNGLEPYAQGAILRFAGLLHNAHALISLIFA